MKIIIPVYRNRVSPVFDWCGNLLLFDIQSRREVRRREVAAAGTDPGKQARRLVELGTDLVVCGGISELLLGLVEASNIRVISGVSGNIDDVLAAMRTKELSHPRFMMPGYTRRHGLRGGFGGKVCKHGHGR